MKRHDKIFSSAASWNHFITITSLIVSLVCFVLFYTKIGKINNEAENILNISLLKNEYLANINDLVSQHNSMENNIYQKKAIDLYNKYVSDVSCADVNRAIKLEEEHFAENIYLKTRSMDGQRIYQEIKVNQNRFPELTKELLDNSKNDFKLHLIILIIIPTLMALIRSMQAVYYFYSLRRLRGNYMIDPLTGVFNRRYMGKIRESEGICYILAIDVDDFKNVNDTYGHAFGDRILQECARSMKMHIRDHDVVVRMGGDEFSIFLFKTDSIGAKSAASRLLDTINKMKIVLPDDNTFTPSLSIGMAKCEGSIERAMHIADQNLYKSKKEGKNALTFDGDR